MKILNQIVKHLLPLSFGIGSIILKFNNVSGWYWFLISSVFLAIVLDDSNEKKEDNTEEKS